MQIDDTAMDKVVEIAANAMVTLVDSDIPEESKGMVGFGISYLVGSLALDDGHEPMRNGDVAQGGHDLIVAYIDRVESEIEARRRGNGD